MTRSCSPRKFVLLQLKLAFWPPCTTMDTTMYHHGAPANKYLITIKDAPAQMSEVAVERRRSTARRRLHTCGTVTAPAAIPLAEAATSTARGDDSTPDAGPSAASGVACASGPAAHDAPSAARRDHLVSACARWSPASFSSGRNQNARKDSCTKIETILTNANTTSDLRALLVDSHQRLASLVAQTCAINAGAMTMLSLVAVSHATLHFGSHGHKVCLGGRHPRFRAEEKGARSHVFSQGVRDGTRRSIKAEPKYLSRNG